MTPTGRHLVTDKAEAETREAEAKVKQSQANTAAKKARADMDAISGVAGAKERARKVADNVKAFAEADLAQTKADFKHVHDTVAAWDAARDRELKAKLQEAEAQLAGWKAAADAKHANMEMKRNDDLASLEEKIALARARAAEAREQRYTAKAQAALEDAARNFDKAWEAAARKYNKG